MLQSISLSLSLSLSPSQSDHLLFLLLSSRQLWSRCRSEAQDEVCHILKWWHQQSLVWQILSAKHKETTWIVREWTWFSVTVDTVTSALRLCWVCVNLFNALLTLCWQFFLNNTYIHTSFYSTIRKWFTTSGPTSEPAAPWMDAGSLPFTQPAHTWSYLTFYWIWSPVCGHKSNIDWLGLDQLLRETSASVSAEGFTVLGGVHLLDPFQHKRAACCCCCCWDQSCEVTIYKTTTMTWKTCWQTKCCGEQPIPAPPSPYYGVFLQIAQ